MTVFPILTNTKNSMFSPSFGKAKYFAFYNGKDLEIVKNETSDGMALIAWLAKKGVENIIIKEIGSNPFYEALRNNIKVFHTTEVKLNIDEVIDGINNNKFELLNEDLIKTIIKKTKPTTQNSHKKRLVFPTDENKKEKSKTGAHFGKAKFYTIVTLNKKNEIIDVETIKNPGDMDGGCVDAVANIMSFNPKALITNDIGSSPAKGFLESGLEIYSDIDSDTVEQSVQKYIDNTLIKLSID